MTEKVIQFGEDGFLRGFADWMLQTVDEKTDFDTHICRGLEGVKTKKINVISRCV